MAEFNTFKFASLLSSLTALICISLAMSKPIATIADFYDIHLFPEDDQIDYRVSDLHHHSQNLHIATTVFLCISILVHFVQSTARSATIRWVQISSAVITMTLYIAAVATLTSTAKHIKDYLDNLPLPLPEIKVDHGPGATADTIGVLAAIAAGIMTMISGASTEGAGYESI